MTPDQAAWVRDHAIPTDTLTSLSHGGGLRTCPCQHGTHGWCAEDAHGRCPVQYSTGQPETYILRPDGTVATWPGGRPAAVWLADRCCFWHCSCPCHADMPAARPVPRRVVTVRAEQLGLFDLVAS